MPEYLRARIARRSRWSTGAIAAGWVVVGLLDDDPAKLGVRVASIDRQAHVVIDEEGNRTPYDKLILAPGAAPLRPPLPGVDLPGVFTLRDLSDTDDDWCPWINCHVAVLSVTSRG